MPPSINLFVASFFLILMMTAQVSVGQLLKFSPNNHASGHVPKNIYIGQDPISLGLILEIPIKPHLV